MASEEYGKQLAETNVHIKKNCNDAEKDSSAFLIQKNIY